jgi:hypothetical protein
MIAAPGGGAATRAGSPVRVGRAVLRVITCLALVVSTTVATSPVGATPTGADEQDPVAITAAAVGSPAGYELVASVNFPAPLGVITEIHVLENGNIVTRHDPADGSTVNAVALVDGASGAILSVLTGTPDWFEWFEIVEIDASEYALVWPTWEAPGGTSFGAVVWCSSTTGCAAPSASNALLGRSVTDFEGIEVTALEGGARVIALPSADGPSGARETVLACASRAVCLGSIASKPVLHGSSSAFIAPEIRSLGSTRFAAQFSGDGGAGDAGTAWCDAAVSCTGPISASNALVGESTFVEGVLPGGSYVLYSFGGRSQWCPAVGGCVGTTSSMPTGASFPFLLDNGRWAVDFGTCPNGPICTRVPLPGGTTIGGATPLVGGDYVLWGTFDVGGAPTRGALRCDGVTGCPTPSASTMVITGGIASVTALTGGGFVVLGSLPSETGPFPPASFRRCPAVGTCAGPISAANSAVSTPDASFFGPTTEITALDARSWWATTAWRSPGTTAPRSSVAPTRRPAPAR